MIPFGLFTTQIPYFILGVMYLLYFGLALLNKAEQSADQTFAVQQNVAPKIDFTATDPANDLPVIDFGRQNVINPGSAKAFSAFGTAVTDYTFFQYFARCERDEACSPLFHTRIINFEGFSRPPPVTA